MDPSANIPANASFLKIQEALSELEKKIHSKDAFSDQELQLFAGKIKSLSEDLHKEIDKHPKASLGDIDQQLYQKVLEQLQIVESTGKKKIGLHPERIQINLWRALSEVKSEINNLKKKVQIDRKSPPEMEGGL